MVSDLLNSITCSILIGVGFSRRVHVILGFVRFCMRLCRCHAIDGYVDICSVTLIVRIDQYAAACSGYRENGGAYRRLFDCGMRPICS
jgi:hypothetical protein